MDNFGRQRVVGCNRMRKGRLLAATLVVSAVLTACGGGDDSPAAAAPSGPRGTPSASGGVPTIPGGLLPTVPGAGSGGTSSGGSVADLGGEPTDTADVPPDPVTDSGPAASDEPSAGDAADTGSVTLSWMPPTMNDDGTPLKLTGYRIYWGTTKDNYTQSVLVEDPGLTRYVVDQLGAGTWYFVATALSDDRESEFSNVFSTNVD